MEELETVDEKFNIEEATVSSVDSSKRKRIIRSKTINRNIRKEKKSMCNEIKKRNNFK